MVMKQELWTGEHGKCLAAVEKWLAVKCWRFVQSGSLRFCVFGHGTGLHGTFCCSFSLSDPSTLGLCVKLALSFLNRQALTQSGEGQPAVPHPLQALKHGVYSIGRKLTQAFSGKPVSTGGASSSIAASCCCSLLPEVSKTSIASQSRSSQQVDLRQLSMLAAPGAQGLQASPFTVNYTLAKVPSMNPGGLLTGDTGLKAVLRDAIHSRQGVFEWVRDGSNGLRSQLERALNFSDSVELGDGVVVHGLETLQTQDGVFQGQVLVSSPAMDMPGEMDTFLVPITEMNVPESNVDQADWLSRAELAFQNHLSSVDLPYQDSVENPLMLSSGCNHLADLHAFYTEASSRIEAGLVCNRQSLAHTLHELAPVFVQQNKMDVSRLLQPILQQQLPLGTMDTGARPGMLVNKRHLLIESGAMRLQAPMPNPAHMFNRAPIPRSVSAPTLAPEPATVPVPSRVCAVAESLSPWGLTLENKPPPYRPNHYQAFRQLGKDNHCAVVSVNGFFQAPVMTSTQAVNCILDKYLSLFQVEGMKDLKFPGLYHPTLIAAMRKGQSVVMHKNEFVNGKGLLDPADYEVLYMHQPVTQWASVCNYKYGDGPKPDKVEITPDLWLSAATGMHLDMLEAIVNEFLRTKGDNPAWAAYPEKVVRIEMNTHAQQSELETRIQKLIDQKAKAGLVDKQFPMICMISGHYFAVARTEEGAWVKLDSNGTLRTGVQRSILFAKRGELEQALQDKGVIHVICEPLPELKKPD